MEDCVEGKGKDEVKARAWGTVPSSYELFSLFLWIDAVWEMAVAFPP